MMIEKNESRLHLGDCYFPLRLADRAMDVHLRLLAEAASTALRTVDEMEQTSSRCALRLSAVRAGALR